MSPTKGTTLALGQVRRLAKNQMQVCCFVQSEYFRSVLRSFYTATKTVWLPSHHSRYLSWYSSVIKVARLVCLGLPLRNERTDLSSINSRVDRFVVAGERRALVL